MRLPDEECGRRSENVVKNHKKFPLCHLVFPSVFISGGYLLTPVTRLQLSAPRWKTIFSSATDVSDGQDNELKYCPSGAFYECWIGQNFSSLSWPSDTSITLGLVKVVDPGEIVGIDIDPSEIERAQSFRLGQ